MRGRLAATLLLALAWVALFAFVRHDSVRTRVSAHGLLHLAIADRCDARAQPDAIHPPEDPLFAGEPLPYYYFFHDFALGVGQMCGLSPLDAMEALVLLAAAAVVLLGSSLGRLLLRNGVAGATIPLLVFAAAHPQGPLVLLLRWMKHGGALFTRQGFAADGDYLWGLVHPALGALRIGDPHATLGPLASYFLNVTARPLALAALLQAMLMVALAAIQPRKLALLGVALAAHFCTLFSPITGLAGCAALGGGIVVAAWLRRRAPDQALRVRWSLWIALSLAAGCLASLPWWWHLLGRGDAAGRLVFQPTRAIGVVAAGWLVMAAAWFGRTRFGGTPRTIALALLIAAAPLVVATVFLALPVGNEDNFFHAALVLLSVPAAGFVLPRPRGVMDARAVPRQARGRALLLHVACLPTLAIVLWSYLGRPPVDLVVEKGQLVRTPFGGPEATLLQWLRAESPETAIVVRDPGPRGRAATGNTSELPALAGRPLFTDYAEHYLVAAHRDAARRARITAALVAAAPIDADDERYLAALARPLLIVADDVDATREAALTARYGPPKFQAGALRVHEWSPGP